MKHAIFLVCLLVACAFAVFPAAAESMDPGPVEPTAEPIIHGVTLEPTEEPTILHPVTREITEEPTVIPTREETTERTAEPTREETTRPVPEVGWLSITSTPSAASVELDGRAIGVTPDVGRELGAGTSHTVRITHEGYEPYSTSVTVRGGEQAAVDATLNPVPTPVPTKEPTVTPTRSQPIGGGKGWISVSANVNGATVSFDDHSAGCTVAGGSCDTEVSVTGTPYRTFTVQKPGYNVYTGTVSSWPQQGETVYLYATLNPVQEFASISVSSYPTGAVAYLDGNTWQYTPCTFNSVTANTNHIVQVSRSGYQTYSTTVYVPAGGSTPVNVNLVPSPSATGSLSITTTPSGADIYIDGRYWSPSPAVVTNLAPGSHTVRIQKAGYDEYISTVTVYAGTRTPISVTFSRLSPTVGSIEVSSSPAGASLYLDGHYMGTTYSGDAFDLTSVAPGLHTVQLMLDDYQTYTQTVRVDGGGIVSVNAVLTPVAPGPVKDTTGQLVIVSSPSGANVLVDNAFRGITPLTIPDIAEGQHTLLVQQAGYADASQIVTVTGGSATPVAVTLTEIVPTATKSPAGVAPVLLGVLVAGAMIALRRR